MSGPKITNFINAFKTDLARPCNFDVIITPNSTTNTLLGEKLMKRIGDKYNGHSENNFRFKCEATDIPSRQFGLVEQNMYGPNIKFPISNSYDDIILRFMCSDDMDEKYFFDSWLDVICLPHKNKIKSSSDSVAAPSDVGINSHGGTDYDFSYKQNYTANIKIFQYGLIGEQSYEITLIDAFPYVVRSMPLRWHDSNDYHKLDVHFNYRYFNYTNTPGNDTGTLKRFLEI